MQDQRVVGRTALDFEDAPQRRRVARVRTEAIDGLGRKNDKLAVTQSRNGSFQFLLSCTAQAGHAPILASRTARTRDVACTRHIQVSRETIEKSY